MTLATLLLFVLASAVAIVTPGPTTLLAMSNGSRHGVRAACWGMGGAVLADLVLIGAVACGLGVLLAASEVAFQIVKWVGAAYLAWLGWKLLRSDAALTLPSEHARDSRSPARPIHHPGGRPGAAERGDNAGLCGAGRADGARLPGRRPALAEPDLRRHADRTGGHTGAVSPHCGLIRGSRFHAAFRPPLPDRSHHPALSAPTAMPYNPALPRYPHRCGRRPNSRRRE